MKKVFSLLLILSSILILVPSTIFAINMSSTVPAFSLSTLGHEPALDSYVMEQIQARKTTFKIKFVDTKKEDFQKIFDYLRNLSLNQSQSDVYQINASSSYLAGTTFFDVKLDYRMTKEQEKKVNQWIKSIMDPYLATKPSDQDKIIFINDTIVRHLEYDTSLQKKSAYNAVFDRTALCEGYTYLGKMMLDYASIENKTIMGKAKNENHVWNLVKFGHNWYHLDFTWNDPVFVNGNKDLDFVSYDYYMQSDKEMSKTHIWNQSNYPKADFSF